MESVDSTRASEGDNTLTLVDTGTSLEALLGSVRVGEKVFEGLGNNTRWVFDIEMLSGADVAVGLLDFHGGQLIKPNVMSTNISPMSEEAAEAKLHWSQEGGTLILHSKQVVVGAVVDGRREGPHEVARILVRVSVDVVCR